MRENAAHVGFRDAVIDSARRLQSARGFQLRHVPALSERGERISAGFRMRLAPCNRDLHTRIDLAEIERARSCGVRIAIAAHGLSGTRAVECVKDLFCTA